jgi:hypothetical protein
MIIGRIAKILSLMHTAYDGAKSNQQSIMKQVARIVMSGPSIYFKAKKLLPKMRLFKSYR